VYYGNLDKKEDDEQMLSFEKAAKCGYAITEIK